MRFLSYIMDLDLLEEGKVVVSMKDLPDWVKKVLKDSKIKKDIMVNTTIDVNIGGNWHEANVKHVYLYSGGKIKVLSTSGEFGPWMDKEETTVAQGFKTKLTPDKMILVTNTYPKGAELYVHPDAVNALLDEPHDISDLSKDEVLILRIVSGLKSAYRRQEAKEYGLNFDSIAATLIEKGYLNKNVSINKKGRNFLLTNHPTEDIATLAKKLGFKGKFDF